jgi:hypothetical protein
MRKPTTSLPARATRNQRCSAARGMAVAAVDAFPVAALLDARDGRVERDDLLQVAAADRRTVTAPSSREWPGAALRVKREAVRFKCLCQINEFRHQATRMKTAATDSTSPGTSRRQVMVRIRFQGAVRLLCAAGVTLAGALSGGSVLAQEPIRIGSLPLRHRPRRLPGRPGTQDAGDVRRQDQRGGRPARAASCNWSPTTTAAMPRRPAPSPSA